MDKEMYKVTVGIPVYNAEKYVEKCILSVLNQTYRNIEILVVDDCGNDKSMNIIYELQKTHVNGSNIRVIVHSCNKGLSAARNTIIANASGKYIFFLDSDDFLSLDAIDVLFYAAEKYDSQVTYGSVRDIDISRDENNPIISYVNLPTIQLLGKDKFAEYVCQDIHYHIYVTSWNILFKTSFLMENNLKFVITRRGEDILFCSDFYPFVERAVLLENVTYNYLIRVDSLMGRQIRRNIDIAEIITQFRNDDYLTNRCIPLKNKSYYDVHCSKVVRYKFSTVCAVLKHRNQIDEKISNKLLKRNIKHPATLAEIYKFQHYRFFNLFFYVVAHLFPFLSVNIIKILGKLKGYI
jgi:glycosyltransferase involved in cell wall biosynthesis